MTTAFGWITLAVAATIALTQAYDASMKAKREVIYTLGRLGVSYSSNREEVEKFNASFTGIANRWGMLREAMAAAVAPLTALGVGVGAGGATASMGRVRETMASVADWTGAMMRGFGLEAGVATRAMGTISTAMNITGDTLGDTFGRLAAIGDKSVLGMQRYITETVSMLEITRKYGGAIEGTEILTSAFGEQLKKGTIGMEALARLAAPAMWSPEQKGAVVSLMQQYAPTEARKLGMEGKGLFDGMMALEKAAKDLKEGGNPRELLIGLDKVVTRLVPAGASTGERAFIMQQLLQQLTGAQITTLEAMNVFKDPKKFAEILNPPKVETPAELMKKATDTFEATELVSERMAKGVDVIRESVLFIAHKMGMPTEEEKSMSESIKKMVTTGKMEYMMNPNLYKELKQKGAQTGGYIPETAEYLLHAGEQVRRPGEGTGGDVNVSLGGLNVSISDRGDMGSQINEAFDQLKQETIEEIEKQWAQSLHAH
jgi:hypothetical protein